MAQGCTPGLDQYLQRQLEVPPNIISSLFPPGYDYVHTLIAAKLPETSHELVHAKDVYWFSNLPPNSDIATCIKSRPIPPLHLLKGLRERAGQALLDGNITLMNPAYPDSRLPIFALTCWERMHELTEIGSLDTLEDAHRRLLAMRWNGSLHIPGAPSQATHLFLVQLLADDQVSTGIVDCMSSYLSSRLEEQPERDEAVVVETLQFMFELGKMKRAKDFNEKSPKYVRRLEAMLREGKKKLLFPVYWPEMHHFFAVKIDFKTREIAYGDSLSHRGMPKPHKQMAHLKMWLSKKFEKPAFELVENGLDHGYQDDFKVCGMVAVNTIAVEALGDPLWNPSRKIYDRARWFIDLLELEAKMVRCRIPID
ncbi:hypothetical protein BDZ89DRAFT_205356 [Hymenopellis radicata]|nr:hypothetical protein BDZ89DRAFT_205356 [Hymenopellis radicata]